METFLVVLTLSTGTLTAVAWTFLRRSQDLRDECERMVNSVRKHALSHELIREELTALGKRQAKLAGRFYRERRVDNQDVLDSLTDDDGVIKGTDRGDGTVDPEWAAMVALQNAGAPPK